MNLSNLFSEISKLAYEKNNIRKEALFNYLIRFLKAENFELYPEMSNILDDMVQDDNIDLDKFTIFVKYFLGE